MYPRVLLPILMLVIPLGAADTGQSGQCSDILVSGKYPIPDSALTASSYFNIDSWWYKHLPRQARIHLVSDDNGNGGWSAYSGGSQEWLQFDLEFPRLITSVITLGREGWGSSMAEYQFVTAYRIYYGNDLNNLSLYRGSHGQEVVFEGNWHPFVPQVRYLDPPVVARYVRINPVSFHNHITLRADLLGCPLYDYSTKTIIG